MPDVSFVCCHSACVVTDVHISSYFFQRTDSKYDQRVLLSLMSAVGCLTRDNVVRCSFAHNADCWMALVDIVVSESVAIIERLAVFVFHLRLNRLSFQSHCRACEYKEVLYALLGFIMNLSAVASPAIQVR